MTYHLVIKCSTSDIFIWLTFVSSLSNFLDDSSIDIFLTPDLGRQGEQFSCGAEKKQDSTTMLREAMQGRYARAAANKW